MCLLIYEAAEISEKSCIKVLLFQIWKFGPVSVLTIKSHIEMFGVEWVVDGISFSITLNIFVNWWSLSSFLYIKAFVSVVSNNCSLTNKNNDDQNNDLIESMSKDVSPHKFGHDWCIFVIRLSSENIISWWFSGESESCEGIHDKVDPEHLNGI